jgi:glycosyltransferase involved in cell wall biosynthesis
MRISARPVHDHPVEIVPAPGTRDWPDGAGRLFADPSLQGATSRGWDLLAPHGFEAVWNGGPAPEDVRIRPAGFAVSSVGHGVITLQTGLQVALDAGNHLWVRGPINHLKDGAQPLDQVIEADLLPFIVAVHWRLTRPNETVRFERGEPFGTILPYPAGYVEAFEAAIEGPALPDAVPDAEAADQPAHGEKAPGGLPGVSCICPTFGRPALLVEAIESFLRQDYRGPKELVVLNDCPEQTLEYDHPEVRIVNVPGRFKSLGEKLNAAVGLCSYDLIAVWTDDDISLPHRLSLSVDRLDRTLGFFKASTALFWNDGVLSGPERNVFHGGSLWTRELFVQARGYPHVTNAADQGIEQRFARVRLDAGTAAELAPADNYFVYRWSGTDSYHVSTLEPGHPDPGAAWEAAGRVVSEQIQAGAMPAGRILLRPGWRRDYAADAAAFVRGLERAAPGDGQTAAPGASSVAKEPPPIAFGSLPRPVPEAEALARFRGGRPRRITVVVPACNEYPLLQRTVEQFQRTLPPRSEIIVVDNGSRDGCADFLASPHDVPPRDRPELVPCSPDASDVMTYLLRYPEPLGVAGARNRGLDHASGEVIVFSDAHNDIPPGWWPPVVATLNRPEVGIIGPAFGIMGLADQATSCGQRIADADLRLEWLPHVQRDPHPVPTLGGGFMALRHEVLAEIGGFDDGMPQWGSEDLEICLRVWMLGREVWVVPEVVIPHYFRDASPYQVRAIHVTHNLLRTAFLHLNETRVAHVLHALSGQAHFARALALCAESDVWTRRDALRARRVRDDDWLFHHPLFAQIPMQLRDVRAGGVD